jgi:putative endonuclease
MTINDKLKSNRSLGIYGEDLAANWLVQRGFKILARNYRVRYVGEIDILASLNNELHVFEVKSTSYFARSAEVCARVNSSKLARILETTAHFCFNNNLENVDYEISWDEIRLHLLLVEIQESIYKISVFKDIPSQEAEADV